MRAWSRRGKSLSQARTRRVKEKLKVHKPNSRVGWSASDCDRESSASGGVGVFSRRWSLGSRPCPVIINNNISKEAKRISSIIFSAMSTRLVAASAAKVLARRNLAAFTSARTTTRVIDVACPPSHHRHNALSFSPGHQRRYKSSVLRKPNERYAPGEDLPPIIKKKQRLNHLLSRLHKVDTAALCDADKSLLTQRQNGAEGYVSAQSDPYVGLSLMNDNIRPRNYFPSVRRLNVDGRPVNNATNGQSDVGDADGIKMIGVARTVQCTRPNDFLAVLRGLEESQPGDVLVVNTLDSTRAVAGGLFCAEAARRSLGGIVIDGKVRDVGQISKFGYGMGGCLVYASGVTPYAGTIQSIGETNVNVICGGVKVGSGDIVVGDGDGVLVGTMESFEKVIDVAENIIAAERNILKGISQGVSLHSMTNYDEHYELRKSGKESALDFRKTRLVSFNGVEHVHLE